MTVEITGPPPGIHGSRLDVAQLRSRARATLAAIGHRSSELSIALVDDAEIAELNREHREKTGPTDVLSFSLLEGDFREHRGVLLGDVVISLETAARQAADRHRSLAEEVSKLLIHGVLHLIGHDHEQDDEARTMQVEERRLWREIRP